MTAKHQPKKHVTAAAVPAPPPTPADPHTDERDVSAAGPYFATVLALLAERGLTPSADAKAIWSDLISAETAHDDGVSIGSDRVLADALAVFGVHVAPLVEKSYPGYGPKRLAFALGLAKQLADAYQAYLHATSRAGIRKAVGKSKRAQHIAGSVVELGTLAKGILDRGKTNAALAEVLEDMGLTHEVVTSAQSTGGDVTQATTAHAADRGATKAQTDALNELDGRVWFELDALVRSADRARTHDGRAIPDLRLENIGRVHHRRAPAEPPPAPLPAPVPAAPPAE